MPEPTPFPEFLNVEQIISAAGDFLEVRDGLRAETLEIARYERRSNSARLWITGLAVVLAFVAMSTRQLCSPSASLPFQSGVMGGGDQLGASAAQDADVECGWALVDAFGNLRHKQANLIKGSFLHLGTNDVAQSASH